MSPTPALEPAVAAPPRRFNLVDSMILTAASALALVPPSHEYLTHIPTKIRAWTDGIDHLTRRRVIPSYVGVDVATLLVKDVLNFVSGILINPLVGLTLAVLWMRLRRPRPPWPALARQPGFVACVAAPAGFLIFLEANYFGADIKPEFALGGAVTTAWVLLAVGRRWTSEPSWIDRLGRFAGIAWIAAALCKVFERLA